MIPRNMKTGKGTMEEIASSEVVVTGNGSGFRARLMQGDTARLVTIEKVLAVETTSGETAWTRKMPPQGIWFVGHPTEVAAHLRNLADLVEKLAG